jgi:hypothetical protein
MASLRKAMGGTQRSAGGQCMARTAKKSELGREPFRRLSDSEILLFVTRTLQPQLDDADAPNVFAKLQDLKDILRQQETTLPDWPNCAGKDRMRHALASAKELIAQITDDLAGVTRRDAAVGEAKSA